jgi:Rho-binding antiterminator
MISCGDYDYIEIACMHGYDIELHLLTGQVISGKALDTQYNSLKHECIKIHSQGTDILVALDEVKSMNVLSKNASFNHVDFTTKN